MALQTIIIIVVLALFYIKLSKTQKQLEEQSHFHSLMLAENDSEREELQETVRQYGTLSADTERKAFEGPKSYGSDPYAIPRVDSHFSSFKTAKEEDY